MKPIDITGYGDAELSLRFLHEETLYLLYRQAYNETALRGLADAHFIYTQAQWYDLLETWENEEN